MPFVFRSLFRRQLPWKISLNRQSVCFYAYGTLLHILECVCSLHNYFSIYIVASSFLWLVSIRLSPQWASAVPVRKFSWYKREAIEYNFPTHSRQCFFFFNEFMDEILVKMDLLDSVVLSYIAFMSDINSLIVNKNKRLQSSRETLLIFTSLTCHLVQVQLSLTITNNPIPILLKLCKSTLTNIVQAIYIATLIFSPTLHGTEKKVQNWKSK